MKLFSRQAAQGDLLITKIDKLPKEVKKDAPDKRGRFIVAHSETGHFHSISSVPGVELFSSKEDPLIAYLRVINGVEVVLEHERNFDQHESLCMKGGTYEIRRQREYTPEGWRRVAD